MTDKTETQASISAWAIATFGETIDNPRLLARVLEEATELVKGYATGASVEALREEAADVCIVLCRVPNIGDRAIPDVPLTDKPNTPDRALTFASRLVGSLANAIEHAGNGYDTAMTETAASAAWWAARFCRLLGGDIQVEVDRKMAINRARQWKLDGTGHGYHVKATQEPAKDAAE